MHKPTQSARWPVLLVAAFLLAPVLYLLSAGPVYWLHSRGMMPPDTLLTITDPIWWFGERFPAFDRAATAYCNWWVPPYVDTLPPPFFDSTPKR